jgi:hypothetical protein
MPPAHSNPNNNIVMEPILNDDGSDVEVMQAKVVNVDGDNTDDNRKMAPPKNNKCACVDSPG